MIDKHPVAIIGGGPVGLLSSILLSQQKVPHILFERYPGTSIHPKACGINMRTVEIFRQIGIEQEVLRQRAPLDTVSGTAWYTNFGPGGREIFGQDAWGGGKYQEEYRRVSPCPYVTIPQIRLEPILQQRALELNPSGLKYESEVINFEENYNQVILTVREKSGAREYKIAAKYVVGADGGRGLTDKLGIAWEGERDIVEMVSAHVKAPISIHHPDPRNFITWFIDPRKGGSINTGTLYHLGPYPTTPNTEEWLFGCAINPNDPKEFTADDMMKRMHETLQIPNLNAEIKSISHWRVNSIVAAQYRSLKGRIFLVGDAAHRIPPWGALGLNTGIQEAHNLIWKLGIAIRSGQPESYNTLLDTYEQERRPIAQRVARTSLYNLISHSSVADRALDISPENDKESNIKSLQSFFDAADHDGESKRQAVERAQEILKGEFHALGAEIGWFYPNVDPEGERVPSDHGGQLLPNGEFDCLNYHPSVIPGHHLPHAWLAKNGTVVSMRDLIAKDKFLLLTSNSDHVRNLESSLVQLEVVGGDAGWRDVTGQWAEYSGINGAFSIVVRPDGIIAWREQGVGKEMLSNDPEWLTALLQRILGYPENANAQRN